MGSNFPCELFKLPSRKDITGNIYYYSDNYYITYDSLLEFIIVNTLTPYDIKVVGAIGDSVTVSPNQLYNSNSI